MAATTPKPEVRVDPRPSMAQRVVASLREDIGALARSQASWRALAERSKAHNESAEVQAEAIEQAEFFATKIVSLKIAINATKG